MKSDLLHQFQKRRSVVYINRQPVPGNINSDDFPDEWQPILDNPKLK